MTTVFIVAGIIVTIAVTFFLKWLMEEEKAFKKYKISLDKEEAEMLEHLRKEYSNLYKD